VTKVLSQAGISLADMYDVEGSIAGVEQLESREVQVVHELGATIAAERLVGNIVRLSTGALIQSSGWNLLFPSLPTTPFRILGVAVIAITAARVDNCQVSIRNNAVITDGVEIPIFVWDGTADAEVPFRWVNNGAAIAEGRYLRQAAPIVGMPSMGFGDTSREDTPSIVFRGSTTAFGAGTVEIVGEIYTASMALGGVSSFGLPIPSW